MSGNYRSNPLRGEGKIAPLHKGIVLCLPLATTKRAHAPRNGRYLLFQRKGRKNANRRDFEDCSRVRRVTEAEMKYGKHHPSFSAVVIYCAKVPGRLDMTNQKFFQK